MILSCQAVQMYFHLTGIHFRDFLQYLTLYCTLREYTRKILKIIQAIISITYQNPAAMSTT